MASKTQLVRLARRKAKKYGVDPDIFVRQINQESGFRDVQSPAGAKGYAQFIDSTARAYGVDVHDPASSFDGAARYMRDNLKKYGSYRRALSAYNSGRPDGYKTIAETKNYVRTILGGKNPKFTDAGGGSSSTTTDVAIPGGTVAGAQDTTIRDLARNPQPLPELVDSTGPVGIAPVVKPSFAAGPPSAGPAPLDLSSYSSATLPKIRDQLNAIPAGGGPLPPAPESPDIEVPPIYGKLRTPRGTKAELTPGKGWGGSQGVAEQLADVTGLTPGSRKRARVMTANGNVSDHYQGNKNAYAIDLNSKGNNPKALEAGARRIAKALGIKNYRPNRIYNVNRNGYRVQLIYGAAVDHGDHVHVGVKKL